VQLADAGIELAPLLRSGAKAEGKPEDRATAPARTAGRRLNTRIAVVPFTFEADLASESARAHAR
jgi:hypothetical protein